MNKISLIIGLAFLLAACSPPAEPEITVEEIQAHLAYMASEELAGRYPGTAEDQELTNYLAKQLSLAGLALITAFFLIWGS